jgi:hypothetical protein
VSAKLTEAASQVRDAHAKARRDLGLRQGHMIHVNDRVGDGGGEGVGFA